jgi:hypothetical protein
MGETSRRLHDRLKRMGRSAGPVRSRRGRSDMPSVQGFIKQGLDPIHAAYAYVQNITSFLAEGVSGFAEMRSWAKVVEKAEEEYMPSGPPMSPLTGSFFTTWAFYDLKIGGGPDTLGTCLIDANDVVRMNPDQLDALKKLCDSRMGIYEHVGTEGPHVRLRELITGDEFACHVASGYRGRGGELWYVRLLPPLVPDLASYHIAFTTPYILTRTSRDDWAVFMKRTMLPFRAEDERAGLHRLLKDGPDANYWNEYVPKAYHHHQPDAIFLAGIPDLKDTLPHA